MWHIRYELVSDAASVEALLDGVYGKARREKPIYRLRETIPPVRSLCFVVEYADALLATIRFWPVAIGGRTPALLMGPIAVHPDWKDSNHTMGLEEWLIRHGLERAHAGGHKIALVFGSNETYQHLGFSADLARSLSLPVSLAQETLLAMELQSGALAEVSGVIQRWPHHLPERKQMPFGFHQRIPVTIWPRTIMADNEAVDLPKTIKLNN